MSEVHVMDHPLIQHKISYIRREDVGTKEFREVISEIASLMCYEATRDLKLQDVTIKTPICEMVGKELTGKKLAVVPILRAGLGMVDGMLSLIPRICGCLFDQLQKRIHAFIWIGQKNVPFLYLSHHASFSHLCGRLWSKWYINQ